MDLPEGVMDALGQVTLDQVALGVIALVAVTLLLRKGWPWLVGFVRLVSAMQDLPKTIEDVALIRHEVLPNGGGSLADSQARTEKQVTDLASDVAHLRRQQAASKTTLFKMNRRMSGLEEQMKEKS